MSTELQKNLARQIVKNLKREKPQNKRELLVSSGYALKSAMSVPQKIIEQIGVVEALNELGFSEQGAKSVVQEIMYNPETDPNARLKATDQVFKVEGSYAPEKTSALNLIVEARLTDNIELKALDEEYMRRTREIYAKGKPD